MDLPVIIQSFITYFKDRKNEISTITNIMYTYFNMNQDNNGYHYNSYGNIILMINQYEEIFDLNVVSFNNNTIEANVKLKDDFYKKLLRKDKLNKINKNERF